MSTACGDMGYMTAEMGITQGGVQDINYARELIENGQILTKASFVRKVSSANTICH